MSTKSKKSLSMSEIVNKVCEELPPGWGLEVDMEQGCGKVRLFDENGEMEVYDPDDETPIEQCVLNALQYAKDRASWGQTLTN